jgi:hypothetical protein
MLVPASEVMKPVLVIIPFFKVLFYIIIYRNPLKPERFSPKGEGYGE